MLPIITSYHRLRNQWVGYLARKENLDSLSLPPRRKLLKGLTEAVLPPLLQAMFFFTLSIINFIACVSPTKVVRLLNTLVCVNFVYISGASSGIGVETSRVLAGIMATPFKLSKDNIKLHIATNHLGHFPLTNLSLETMKTTSRERKTEGRLANVSSLGHRYIYRDGFCFDKISDDSRYQKYYAYGQSKLANILHANELTRRLKEEGAEVTANSLHPGTMLTNFMRYDCFLWCLLKVLGILVSKTVEQGVGGKYFVDCNVTKPSSQAKNADLAAKPWDFSSSLTNPE
ncbi:short-chain dehydrogenase TIC 32, chloroplastic-like isoform X2 [Malus sylvestris]|uniref:short-chain dehydrogenase TIC 32, chloroplastic-like isoform X2 n=1 Tax=Malus sylvestris TaxID=3752 RepID=UPI0021ACF32B|nr:short-chain dehydrogenase TIC 32, chloroplastic-like isoform X2 [Malus sylvestris]